MKTRYCTKYFPFSPGIPWLVKNEKYIVPEIDQDIWENAIENKDVIVTAFGGILESFFSLSYIEMMHKLKPSQSVSWKGYKQYNLLPRAQGLATVSSIGIMKKHLRSYPAPLFFDKDNNVYLNVLNNYITTISISKRRKLINKEPIAKQLSKNLLSSWEKSYTPILRKTNDDKLNSWMKDNHFNKNKKYILVFPEHELSLHKERFLEWNAHNVKECASMLRGFGISLVVVTSNLGLYHGSQVKAIEYDMMMILGLLQNANLILSSTIDWLIVGMMISQADLLSVHHEGIFDLHSNIDFLEESNVISTFGSWISPMDVHVHCEGIK